MLATHGNQKQFGLHLIIWTSDDQLIVKWSVPGQSIPLIRIVYPMFNC